MCDLQVGMAVVAMLQCMRLIPLQESHSLYQLMTLADLFLLAEVMQIVRGNEERDKKMKKKSQMKRSTKGTRSSKNQIAPNI